MMKLILKKIISYQVPDKDRGYCKQLPQDGKTKETSFYVLANCSFDNLDETARQKKLGAMINVSSQIMGYYRWIFIIISKFILYGFNWL